MAFHGHPPWLAWAIPGPSRGLFSKLKARKSKRIFVLNQYSKNVFFQNFGQNRKWLPISIIFDFDRNFEKKPDLQRFE